MLYQTGARAARAHRAAAGRRRRAEQHGDGLQQSQRFPESAGRPTARRASTASGTRCRSWSCRPTTTSRTSTTCAANTRGRSSCTAPHRRACDALGDTYHSALCDLDRSEIYLELNLSDEAADLGLRALARFDELGMEYEAAKAVTNVAIATSSQGELPRALELFERARGLFAREQNQVWLALVDFYEALVLYRSGEHVRARQVCRTALSCCLRARPLPGEPGSASCCWRAWSSRPAISLSPSGRATAPSRR